QAAALIEDSGGKRTRTTAETRVQAAGPLHLTFELNPNPAQPGELVNGQLTVANTGPVALLGIKAEIFFPDGMTPFDKSQTSGTDLADVSCISGNGACFPRVRLVWSVDTVAAGTAVVLRAPLGIAATVDPGSVLAFNARA